MRRVKIAFIGVGAISDIYLDNITQRFTNLEIVGLCDQMPGVAETAAKKYGLAKVYKDIYEICADEQVEIILNLTRPYEHYHTTKTALLAGKHVYSEKPLGATLAEGRELAALAAEKGLLLGGAPDTFLGAGLQTCRRIIDAGLIGDPVGFTAFMTCHGHESWHPNPAFYYQFGGGPMLDMGPYYLTAIVTLLGGVSSVSGMTKISFPQRMITSQPHYGERIDVEVPTWVMGMLRLENGAVGSIFTTFDVYETQKLPFIEIYGSEGTLSLPDPNTFGGSVWLRRREEKELAKMPLMADNAENSRGLGLQDMARALVAQTNARASVQLTLHVLEVMCAFQTSSDTRAEVVIQSKPGKPAPMEKQDQ
jgi:predicted dehydrogenase